MGLDLKNLYKDLERCQEALNDDFTDLYVKTEARLDLVIDLVNTYQPDALEDVFNYNSKSQNEWEAIEHEENIKKRDMYI